MCLVVQILVINQKAEMWTSTFQYLRFSSYILHPSEVGRNKRNKLHLPKASSYLFPLREEGQTGRTVDAFLWNLHERRKYIITY